MRHGQGVEKYGAKTGPRSYPSEGRLVVARVRGSRVVSVGAAKAELKAPSCVPFQAVGVCVRRTWTTRASEKYPPGGRFRMSLVLTRSQTKTRLIGFQPLQTNYIHRT